MTDDAIGRLLRNLLALERIANTVALEAEARVQKLYREIVEDLQRIDPTGPVQPTYRRLRTDQFLKDVTARLRTFATAEQAALKNRLALVGRVQAKHAETLLRATLGQVGERRIRITPITQQRMRAILNTDPFQGRLLSEHVNRIGANAYVRVRDQIRLGMMNEEPIPDLVRRIRGSQAGFIRQDPETGAFVPRGTKGAVVHPRFVGGVLSGTTRETEALVRTAVTHVSNAGMRATFGENGAVLAGVRFVATLDDRTTEICLSLDGTVWPVDSAKIRTPPLHYNALLSGTRVTTLRGPVPVEDVEVGDVVLTHAGRWRPVYAVMGRPIGESRPLALQTSTGRMLRVTDEHPVLTTRGWRRAGDLQVGDQLFQDAQELPGAEGAAIPRVTQAVLLDAHHRPAAIDEPPIPLSVLSVTAGMSATVQLQRDQLVHEREVDDVRLHGMLEAGLGMGTLEEIEHEALMGVRLLAIRASDRPCPLPLRLSVVDRVGIPAHALAMYLGQALGRLGSLRAPVLLSGGVGAFGVGLAGRRGLAAHVDPMATTPRPEDRLSQAHLPLDLADGLSRGHVLPRDQVPHERSVPQRFEHGHSRRRAWAMASITNIAAVPCQGNVWNLAVAEDETYLAEGLVVHNCRSTLVPEVDWAKLGLEPPPDAPRAARDLSDVSEDDLHRKVSARRRSGDLGRSTQLPSSVIAADWLKRQPVRVQEKLLGVGKAKLFRQGKISLSDLVRQDNTIVSLEELVGAV